MPLMSHIKGIFFHNYAVKHSCFTFFLYNFASKFKNHLL